MVNHKSVKAENHKTEKPQNRKSANPQNRKSTNAESAKKQIPPQKDFRIFSFGGGEVGGSRKKYFLAFAHNKGGDGGMKEYTTEEQNELIAKEVDRINSIFIDLPESKREVAKELIERIAFMTIQMKIMEETIKEKGPTYLFINGSQQMLVENPAQKSYNTSMNRYTAAYDKLFNLLSFLEEADVDEPTDI